MPGTYEPIATTTLSTNTATVTFSSISGTYTDLVLVCVGKVVSGIHNNLIRFNSDTGTNYSRTYMYGDSSSTFSGTSANQTALAFPYFDSISNMTITHIMNYSNTTTYKTALSRNAQPSGTTTAEVGVWRNTSAITTVTITKGNQDFVTGSTFTLYGIKAA